MSSRRAAEPFAGRSLVTDGRERFLVAVTGAPGGEHLVRRAAALAERARGDLLGIHVTADAGQAALDEAVAAHGRLLRSLGGDFREVTGAEVAGALLDVARAEGVTQIVLGASRRSVRHRLLHGSVINDVVRQSGPVDVLVISDDRPPEPHRLGGRRTVLTPLSPRRQLAGWVMVGVTLPLLTLLLANTRADLHLPSVLLLYLLATMAAALIGGALPALAAAVGGLLLADYFFTLPLYELSVAEAEEVIALGVYLAAAAIVSLLVDRIARLRLDASRATVEAEAMAALAGSLAEPGALPEVLAHLRATFGLSGAALFRQGSDRWELEAGDGRPAESPEAADLVRPVGPDRVLALSGGPLRASDLRVLSALAGQLATAVEARRLQDEADRVRELRQANDLRTALLQAVSHDLRSPLAGIKASVSSLRADEVVWGPEEEAEFLRTIEEETDRLDVLVANLLDMGRIQAGAVRPSVRRVGLEEVVPSVLAGLGPRTAEVRVDVPETLTAVDTDPVLLERVLANLLVNAVEASPEGAPVTVSAHAWADGLELRVIDHGPGIPMADREAVFAPFQRTTDHGSGVGLGLAIVRGFLDAIGGELVVEDTPGGGTTMVVRLPSSAVAS